MSEITPHEFAEARQAVMYRLSRPNRESGWVRYRSLLQATRHHRAGRAVLAELLETGTVQAYGRGPNRHYRLNQGGQVDGPK